MKRFLFIFISAVVVIFCGFSIYHVVKNDEVIFSTIENSSKIYLNLNEVVPIPVKHEKKSKETEISVELSDENIVDVDFEAGKIVAKNAGTTLLTISSTNKNFETFEFMISVGNGSLNYPYYVRNEEDLTNIGQGMFSLSSNYELVNNINLTKIFNPIGSNNNHFTGSFSGGYKRYSINNLTIINDNVNKSTGLFSVVGVNGRVENLVINNADITAKSKFAGIIAGENYGLIGKNEIYNSNIINDYKNLDKNSFSYTGLVAGLNESVSGYAQIRLNTASGSLCAKDIAGGIVGRNEGGVISNNNLTLNKLSLSSNSMYDSFGGVAGYCRDAIAQVSENNNNNFASTVINNLVSVNEIKSNTNKIGGVFGGLSSSSSKNKGIFSTILYSLPKTYPAVSFVENTLTPDIINEANINSINNLGIKQVNSSDLILAETFKNINSCFDLDNIWKLDNGKSVGINYYEDNLHYQKILTASDVFVIDSNESLAKAISQMVALPSLNVTYLIKGEYKTSTDEFGIITEKGVYTYDTKNLDIIGTKEQNFMGSIISEKGAKIKFVNYNCDIGKYAGLFGVVNGGKLQNIVIQGANINGDIAGGIAGVNINAEIDNCEVISTNIMANENAGGIVGLNFGEIKNSSCSFSKFNIIVNEEENIAIGGITAINNSKVLNSKSYNNSINLQGEFASTLANVGGISGLNKNAYVQNCTVSDFNIEAFAFYGDIFVGGICGVLVNSTVDFCGVLESEIKSSSTFVLNENSESFASGLVAVVDDQSKLIKSSVGAINLNADVCAGLVACNDGLVEQCYVAEKVVLNGNLCGGLVSTQSGLVKDCYTYANLNAKEIQSGLANFIYKNSRIENCFTYCSYADNSKKSFGDTSSNYQSMPLLFGDIVNSIVFMDLNNDVKKDIVNLGKNVINSRNSFTNIVVQESYYYVQKAFDIGSINIKEEHILFGEDAFKCFLDLNFDANIWTLDSSELGRSPTLKYCFKSGYENLSKVEE